MKLSIRKFILFVTLVFASKSNAVNVDLLVLYTADFSNVNNAATAIQSYISYSNQVFINSGIDIQFRLKHHQVLQISGGEEVSESLRNKLFYDEQVMSLRGTHRPDIVVYLTRASSSLCGIAEFPSVTLRPGNIYTAEREMAFKGVSVVGWDCGAAVFSHEIGHNLGAGHGPVASGDHQGIPIVNSRGHGVRDVFRTVMAYPDVFGSAPRLAYHSNPAISYNGLATGTADRNNAYGMKEIAEKHVQYYSSCFPASVTMRYGLPIYSCGTAPGYCAEFSGGFRPTCIRLNPN